LSSGDYPSQGQDHGAGQEELEGEDGLDEEESSGTYGVETAKLTEES